MEYKASDHGFRALNFHDRCDGKPLLVVIQSTQNYLFGGFTSVGFNINGSHIQDDASFIFTLSNPHGVEPTKFVGSPNYGYDYGYQYPTIYGATNNGPYFGQGDIAICDNSNINSSSTNFPYSYQDTTGYGNQLFVGSSNFRVKDIFAFSASYEN